MKKLYTLLFVALTSLTFGQTTITQWNFNADSNVATTGTGTISLIGNVTSSYATGNDPVTGTTDKALNLAAFPADGTLSGTAGLKAAVNTTGYSGITVSYDRKGSNTASKWEQFEYTIDGTAWVVLGNNGGSTTNVGATTVWPTTTYTLPATANNNANFAVRMVSIFAPTTSAYAPISTTYGVGGTWRFDNLTVKGTTLGVNQNSISGLNVYPNPVTNGTLYINTDANAERTVSVFDVLGKQVLKVTTSNSAINVANLNAGVYIVKVTEEGKTATRKLVIR
jgi:hypothetical protein